MGKACNFSTLFVELIECNDFFFVRSLRSYVGEILRGSIAILVSL